MATERGFILEYKVQVNSLQPVVHSFITLLCSQQRRLAGQVKPGRHKPSVEDVRTRHVPRVQSTAGKDELGKDT